MHLWNIWDRKLSLIHTAHAHFQPYSTNDEALPRSKKPELELELELKLERVMLLFSYELMLTVELVVLFC